MARADRPSTLSGPRRASRFALVSALLAVACQTNGEAPGQAASPLPHYQGAPRAPADAGTKSEAVPPRASASNLRVMAANISSGNTSTYEPGEGTRMFQGLRPDLALVQEMKFKSNSDDDMREFVTDAFGSEFSYYVEPNVGIPNAIVSRYPILEGGRWDDPEVGNRNFVYAKIDVPGPHDLWAVSVHLLTAGPTSRSTEARALVAQLKNVVRDDDFLVVGGDFNTDTRGESCMSTLQELVKTGRPFPTDQHGNDDTSANRNKPYDWVMAGPSLQALQVPTLIGDDAFASGLVFDSRVFEPISAVAPVKKTDSAAFNMQHMPVVKDFALPE